MKNRVSNERKQNFSLSFYNFTRKKKELKKYKKSVSPAFALFSPFLKKNFRVLSPFFFSLYYFFLFLNR